MGGAAIFWTLRRTAALLKRRAGGRKALPALLLFTDPARLPDAEAAARTLPPGSAIVFRHFGAADAEARARRLVALAKAGGLRLLIGADAGLAFRVGAHGVHLPERMAHRAGPLKRRRPDWIVTAAAHSLRAARVAGPDAVVISPAFTSRSPSAGRPLGPTRLSQAARMARRPLYALGGVNDHTARRLAGTGLAGLAAVEGLRT